MTAAECVILAALQSGDRPAVRTLLAERIQQREHPTPVGTDKQGARS